MIKLGSRMIFQARVHRTDPQNIGGRFRTFSGFLRNTSLKENEPKNPEIYLGPKVSGVFLRNEHQLIP